ncbi:MAG: PDZ domain-containing protein [Dokdonella sp.]|nr:PDZ domain-containing protein [Dokdonella sp.]
MNRNLRTCAFGSVLACLTGCMTRSVVVEAPAQPDHIAPAAEARFETVEGRGPDEIVALRAAPAPARPQLVEGTTPLADRRAQAADGHAHVGSIRFAADDPRAEDKAYAAASRVGADRMLVYRHHVPAEGAGEEYLAMYYVRLKLLFGATFRNLTAAERAGVDNRNGVQIGSVITGTPASDANLMPGDFVLALDGRPLRDRVEFQSLLRDAAGRPVTLTVRRGEVTLERVVRLGALPQAGDP